MSSSRPVQPGVGPVARKSQPEPEPESNESQVDKNHPVRRFYNQVARRVSTDGFEPGSAVRQFGSEIERREDPEATLDLVATRKVQNAKTLLQRSADEVGEAFEGYAERGRAAIQDIRSAPTTAFGGQLMLGVDALERVASYEPALALAIELAKEPVTGGTDLIPRALDFLHLPDDVSETLANQLRTLQRVTNQMPATGEVHEPERTPWRAFLELDQGTQPKVVPSRKQVELGARLDDCGRVLERTKDALERVNPMAEDADRQHGEVWKTMRSELHPMVELSLDPMTDPSVRGQLLDAVWRGLSELTERFPYAGEHAPASLLADCIRHRALDFVRIAGQTKPDRASELMLAAERKLTRYESKMNAPAHELAKSVAAISELDASARGKVLDRLQQIDPAGQRLAAHAYAPTDDRARSAATAMSALDANVNDKFVREFPGIILDWPKNMEMPWSKLVRLEDPKESQLLELVRQRKPLSDIVAHLAEAHDVEVSPALLSLSTSSSVDERVLFEGFMARKSISEIERQGFSLSLMSFSDRMKRALETSTELMLMPMQVQEGVVPTAEVAKRFQEAVARTLSGSASAEWIERTRWVAKKLLAGEQGERFASVMADALRGKSNAQAPALLSTLQASKKLPEDQIALLYQDYIAATRSVRTLPYAGKTPEENLERLLQAPLDPELFFALDVTELPANGMEKLIELHAPGSVSPAHLELFRRAVEQKVSASALGVYAARVARVYVAPMAAMLRSAQRAGYGSSFGAAFTATLLEEGNLVSAEHVNLAADHRGQLFEDARLLELAAHLPEVAESWLLSPPKGVKDEQLGEVAKVALERRKGLPEGPRGAGLSSFLARLDAVRTAGAKVEIDPELVASLVKSASAVAQNDSNLGRAVQLGAKLNGMSTEAFLGELLPAADADQLGRQNSARDFAVWFRLLAIADTPQRDVFDRVLQGHIEANPTPPCLMPAVDFLARPDIDADGIAEPLQQILVMAGRASQLGLYEDILRRLEVADGSGGKNLALEKALARAAEAPNSPWAKTRMGQRAMASSAFADAAPLMREAATSGERDVIKKLAQRAAKAGDQTSLFIDKAFETLRAHARATRPTLKELDTVHDIRPVSPDGAATPSRGPTRVLLDEIEVPVFAGAHLVAPVPSERNLDTSLPSWRSNTIRLLESAVVPDKPTIVLGTSGTAKTSSIEWVASQIEAPLLRLNGHPTATVEELFGQWELDGEGRPTFSPGLFVEMWQRGGIILVDEFNLFPPKIQNLLAEFARGYHAPFVEFSIGGQVVKLARDPNTRMILSGNYGYAGTNAINDDLAHHSNIIYFDEIPAGELETLLLNEHPSLDQELVAKASDYHAKFDAMMGAGELNDSYALTIRNVLRVGARLARFRGDDPAAIVAREVREVYLDGVTDAGDREKLTQVFEETFGIKPEDTRPPREFYAVEIGDSRFSIGDATLPVGPHGAQNFDDLRRKIGTVRDWPVLKTERLERMVYHIVKQWSLNETPHLVGPDENGKSIALEIASRMTGWDGYAKDFHSETDLDQLLGAPTVLEDAETGRTKTEWMDGHITRRARIEPTSERHLVFRHVDRARASVLGRLYPVLEEERQYPLPNGEPVQLSPDFHAAATSQLRPGESVQLSPAMANRMTRSYEPGMSEAEQTELLTHAAKAWGLPPVVGESIVRFQSIYNSLQASAKICGNIDTYNLNRPSVSRMAEWLDSIRQAKARGGDIKDAFIRGAVMYYHVPNADGARSLLTDVASALAEGDEDRVAALTA